jgi:hypothetical protein
MNDDDECGALGGMIGRGTEVFGKKKTAPVPLSPPQIPLDLIWARTWAAPAVGSQRPTELRHGLRVVKLIKLFFFFFGDIVVRGPGYS